MKHPHTGKQRVLLGEWLGCPAKDCEKGDVFLEVPGRCALVACTVCDGKGYIPLWKCVDRTKLRQGNLAA